MNSLSIAILVGVLINISYGYKHNCFEKTTIRCTIILMPGEPAYKLFLDSLKDSETSHGIGLLTGETDQDLINKENALIEKYVSEESKKTFFSKLNNVYYKPGSKVEITPCNSSGNCRYY
uniref:Pro-melanin concentrating hormone n=1 Tax=Strongyloides papillosus TaxID=174720 RepID=A0A0N5BU60_STREA